MKSLCSLVKFITTLFAVVVLATGSALSAASTNPLNIPTNFASQANIDDLANGYFKQISAMTTVENKIQALSTLIDRSDRATFNASTQTAFGKLVEEAYKMATSESSNYCSCRYFRKHSRARYWRQYNKIMSHKIWFLAS